MSASIDKIVDVSVEVSNPVVIASDFAFGCILSNSDSAKKVLKASTTVKVYTKDNYATQMVADGFATTDDECKGATVYFSQSPSPSKLAIGYIDSTSSSTVSSSFASVRKANNEVYAYAVCSGLVENASYIASAVEAASQPSVCFVDGEKSKLATLATADVTFNRTCVFEIIDTVTNAAQTAERIYAVLGLFCGMNTMRANSTYTMAYKQLVGIAAEDISTGDVEALEAANVNTYCKFGNTYNFVYPGLMKSGRHVDEQYMLDAVKFLIQQNALYGLTSKRVIPQTDDGVAEIVSYITAACENIRSIGFIASGVWTGGTVLELNDGDAITNGYLIQAGTIASQSVADRKARKSPPIYVALKAAGAIEHIIVRVFVNQ